MFLSTGCIQHLIKNNTNHKSFVQILDIKKRTTHKDQKIHCILSDGNCYIPGILSKKYIHLVTNGDFQKWSIIHLIDFKCIETLTEKICLIIECDVVSQESKTIGSPQNALYLNTDQYSKQNKTNISKPLYQQQTFIQKSENNNISEYNNNQNIDSRYKYKKILKSRNEQGFKNTSNLYSISSNAKIGGKIGWVRETQLSKEILNKIEKVNVGDVTKPVQVANGFILIKINNKRKKNIKINFDEELNKLINIEKNKQYNQFSSIYFNKIKQNILISEI